MVIAVDDSKSMADSGCGGFALEALTLMCRAMARLEVGELGVVRFGGPGGVVPLQVLVIATIVRASVAFCPLLRRLSAEHNEYQTVDSVIWPLSATSPPTLGPLIRQNLPPGRRWRHRSLRRTARG